MKHVRTEWNPAKLWFFLHIKIQTKKQCAKIVNLLRKTDVINFIYVCWKIAREYESINNVSVAFKKQQIWKTVRKKLKIVFFVNFEQIVKMVKTASLKANIVDGLIRMNNFSQFIFIYVLRFFLGFPHSKYLMFAGCKCIKMQLNKQSNCRWMVNMHIKFLAEKNILKVIIE